MKHLQMQMLAHAVPGIYPIVSALSFTPASTVVFSTGERGRYGVTIYIILWGRLGGGPGGAVGL